MKKRTGLIIGWICAGLVSALTIFSAIMEFVPFTDPATIEYVARLGVTDIAYALGVTKLIIVAIYLYPRTSTVGFVLMVGYFGGALATNITHQMPVADYAPLYVLLILLTISAYFRNPELLSRVLGRSVPEKI